MLLLPLLALFLVLPFCCCCTICLRRHLAVRPLLWHCRHLTPRRVCQAVAPAVSGGAGARAAAQSAAQHSLTDYHLAARGLWCHLSCLSRSRSRCCSGRSRLLLRIAHHQAAAGQAGGGGGTAVATLCCSRLLGRNQLPDAAGPVVVACQPRRMNQASYRLSSSQCIRSRTPGFRVPTQAPLTAAACRPGAAALASRGQHPPGGSSRPSTKQSDSHRLLTTDAEGESLRSANGQQQSQKRAQPHGRPNQCCCCCWAPGAQGITAAIGLPAPITWRR